VNLSKDDIWGVRKACAETLPIIASILPDTDKVKNSTVYDIFERYVDDPSRWVKIEALKQLGPFIATFKDGDLVPDTYVTYFTDMAFQGSQNDSDLVEYCAFNFPAVALTLGKSNWSKLEKAYGALVKDVQAKVRRSLSFSLHEIAKIVGPEISEKSLCPAFDLFLKDFDDVKLGVISNLGSFLSNLSDKTREYYFIMISELPDDIDNWRIREELAGQLSSLLILASPEQVEDILLTLCLTLLNDQTNYCVRKKAFDCSGLLFNKLLSEKTKKGREIFLKFLKALVEGSCFKRQMALFGFESIIPSIDKKVYSEYFEEMFKKFFDDKVPNVRLCLSKVVRQTLETKEWNDDEDFLQFQKQLNQDEDKDVQYFVKHK
jgi:serine/threonine-protein phosphatase 4 regulatory subunit 1